MPHFDFQSQATQDKTNRAIELLSAKQAAKKSGGGLAGSFQKAIDEANAANKKRRDEILALFEGMGEQEKKDISQRFSELGSRAGQSLISRGLSATTIGPSVQAGIEREKSGALASLEDQLARQKAGFLERIEETGPNLQFLAQLAQLQGQGSRSGRFGGSRGGFSALDRRNAEVRAGRGNRRGFGAFEARQRELQAAGFGKFAGGGGGAFAGAGAGGEGFGQGQDVNDFEQFARSSGVAFDPSAFTNQAFSGGGRTSRTSRFNTPFGTFGSIQPSTGSFRSNPITPGQRSSNRVFNKAFEGFISSSQAETPDLNSLFGTLFPSPF